MNCLEFLALCSFHKDQQDQRERERKLEELKIKSR